MPIGSGAIRRRLLVSLSIFVVLLSCEASKLDLVEELTSLQNQSPGGLIHLNEHLVSRFVTSVRAPRPYHLLIFFDANQLHDKAELRIPQLKREFSLLASSYVINNQLPPSPPLKPIFFCDLEFKESKSVFALFEVNTLPHVRIFSDDVQNPKDSPQMDQGDFARLADSMAEFVQSRTGLEVGPIHRPPPISRTQMIIIAVALLIMTPFLIKRVLSGDTPLHDSKTWLSGAIFIYFFSVSGTMHNIIRGMPMFLPNRDNPSELIYFYKGSGMQLGAEGFAVGALYTVVGLVLGIIVHGAVRIRNQSAQRVIMIVGMTICFYAVRKVIVLDNWKTGYGIHAFWPTSWR